MPYSAPFGDAVNFSSYETTGYSAPLGNAVNFTDTASGVNAVGAGGYWVTGGAIGAHGRAAACAGTYQLSGQAQAAHPHTLVGAGSYATSGQAQAAANSLLSAAGEYRLSGQAFIGSGGFDGAGAYSLSGAGDLDHVPPSYTATGAGRLVLSGHATGFTPVIAVGGGAFKLSGRSSLNRVMLVAGAGSYALRNGLASAIHGRAAKGAGAVIFSGAASGWSQSVKTLRGEGAYRMRGACAFAETDDGQMADFLYVVAPGAEAMYVQA